MNIFLEKYKDENGILIPFYKQLLEFEYGLKDFYFPFLVNENSNKLEYANIDNNPLIINVSTIQKLKQKHKLDLNFMINIDKIVENSIFAIDSLNREDSKVFIPGIKNKNDNSIIFTVANNKLYKHNTVNEITSMYDKKNLTNLIRRTMDEGKKIYINPEKEHDFINGIDLDIDDLKTKFIISKIHNNEIENIKSFDFNNFDKYKYLKNKIEYNLLNKKSNTINGIDFKDEFVKKDFETFFKKIALTDIEQKWDLNYLNKENEVNFYNVDIDNENFKMSFDPEKWTKKIYINNELVYEKEIYEMTINNEIVNPNLILSFMDREKIQKFTIDKLDEIFNEKKSILVEEPKYNWKKKDNIDKEFER